VDNGVSAKTSFLEKKRHQLASMHDLIEQIEDARLRERLMQEWQASVREKKFGLVFEPHLPELLPLPKVKPRRGDLVCVREGSLKDLWRVRRVANGVAFCVKPGVEVQGVRVDPAQFSLDELLVVRQFGEPIFPALIPVDQVQNGETEAPWHTLIEADNFHALQLLDYLYAGQVDCIYIDPPYNTGARDWKYNNDYVDGNDVWRHSKWLAFMDRRLRLAKRLLKPETGVLIVTIDEKEYLHLGMLLEKLFPEADIQMVSSVINPKGTGRANEFLRVNEFVFFVWNSEAKVGSFEFENPTGGLMDWETMRRRNLASIRGRKGKGACGPNQFYPIYVNRKSGHIQEIGVPLKERALITSAPKVSGCDAVFPIRPDGTEMNWSLKADACRSRWQQGYVRAGKHQPDEPQSYIIQFLPAGAILAIKSGDAEIVQRNPDGSVEARLKVTKSKTPTTQWNNKWHNAEHYGTNLLKDILPGDNFPYPKSVYAIHDTLRIFTGSRPDALILDFFAGSGTTLHAVNLLNAADDGKRRCILVTNNEVSAEDAATLGIRGLQPGDEAWEALGICRSVTWLRSKFTILGRRDDGSALPGEYLTGKLDEKAKERTFTQIGFVDPKTLLPAKSDTDKRKREVLKLQQQVLAVVDGLPQSAIAEPCRFAVSDDNKHSASILFDGNAVVDWLEALEGRDHINSFYIVTQAKKVFDSVKDQVADLLGPIYATEEEKRPMSEGFAANLAYFKLDFLDKDRVALKQAFREVLPILWLKAGAVGRRPGLSKSAAEPAFFDPEGTNFAVLLDEGSFGKFMCTIVKRTDLSVVYIVTDADEAFKDMADEVRQALSLASPRVEVLQLYKDYLANFLINTRLDQGLNGQGGQA
jgi:adenine-specific DNA-methyltransferase